METIKSRPARSKTAKKPKPSNLDLADKQDSSSKENVSVDKERTSDVIAVNESPAGTGHCTTRSATGPPAPLAATNQLGHTPHHHNDANWQQRGQNMRHTHQPTFHGNKNLSHSRYQQGKRRKNAGLRRDRDVPHCNPQNATNVR